MLKFQPVHCQFVIPCKNRSWIIKVFSNAYSVTVNQLFEDFFRFLKAFGPLSEMDEELVLPHLTTKTLKKKELLLESGQYCKKLWFVHTGLLRAFRVEQGDELNLGFVAEQQFYTDFESIFTGDCCSYTTQALENTVLIEIPYERMLAAYEQSHAIEHLGRLMVERAFMLNIRSNRPANVLSPMERYERFLQEEPELANRVPLKILASHLRMAPETLSRIRKRRFNRTN